MQKFGKYLVSYQFEGAEWNFEIPATSFEDAHRRLRQLQFGRVEGELVTTISKNMSSVAKLAVQIRNLIRRA